jgi:hypothetical protein
LDHKFVYFWSKISEARAKKCNQELKKATQNHRLPNFVLDVSF